MQHACPTKTALFMGEGVTLPVLAELGRTCETNCYMPCTAAVFACVCCSAQLELEAVQIRVKAVNAALGESKQYLEKLPDYLKDVEKALVPLRK